MDLIQLKQKDINEVKEKILNEQNHKCALCGCDLDMSNSVLDHQHKIRKSDINGENGNGLIRGVLCSNCNVLEGKMWNNGNRFLHQPSKEERIKWLENLIEYYKKDLYPYIHPTEKEKEKDVSKSNFNKLNKLYKMKYPKKKPLEYPKSKKLTKQLEILFEEFEIEPYN